MIEWHTGSRDMKESVVVEFIGLCVMYGKNQWLSPLIYLHLDFYLDANFKEH